MTYGNVEKDLYTRVVELEQQVLELKDQISNEYQKGYNDGIARMKTALEETYNQCGDCDGNK